MVEGFAHIQFYSHEAFLSLSLVVEIMHNFKCNQDVVSNETFEEESALVLRDNVRQNILEPVGEDF